MVFFRFVAFVLLVGLLAVVGINVYNAGVSAGIASDVGTAIASGAPVPAGYYYGPYVGQPWGHGFGFGGFLLGLLFLFFFFGLLRAIFGWGRWGGHHGEGGHSSGHSRWSSRNDYLDSWHRERHGETQPAPAPEKT
ncbi:MAG: hypothetical protein M3P32_05275 [Chloroflexota bacterium]|nr:hypothetical protein [Chloroflexota bacterium]